MEQAEQLDYQIYKEYQIEQKVGRGTYGVVFRGRHKRTGRVVAIKKIIDAFQNLIDAKRTYRELNYLLQLEHPSVVRLQHLLHLKRGQPNHPNTSRLLVPPASSDPRGATTDKLSAGTGEEKHVYAVFECMETDLACVLQKCKQVQVIQRKYLGYQLLQGLAYLHRSGLVHRDIKPSNLLLNCNSLELKICDFGMARLKVEGEALSEGVLTEYVASRWYRPPEALLGITTCAQSIDMWSAGCVLAEMVFCSPIFRGKSTLDQLQLILKCIGMPSSTEIDRLPSETAQFMLHKFTFSRRCKMRTLQDLLSPCAPDEIELIMGLLRFDPNGRMTAEEALRHEYFNQVRGMSGEIQKFSTQCSKILDFSVIAGGKGQERSGGIEHYRMLIEQLQKYAQRSTNRSANICSQQQGLSKEIQFEDSMEDKSANEPFREKSTKESDFLTINKHHYLSSTHSLAHKQPQVPKEEEKTVVEVRKMKKKKAVSKADILEKTSLVEKSEKAMHGNKKQVKKEAQKMKTENKQRKAVTLGKKSQQVLHRNASTKGLINKERHESLGNQKKVLLLHTQPLPKKRQNEQKDIKWMLSKSSSSLHRLSKEKGTVRQQTDKQKVHPQVKILVKPSLNLNKSALIKCKSPKFTTQTNKHS